MSSSCCTPDGSCSTQGGTQTATAGTTTTYRVAGMTCGHCKATLTQAIGALPDVHGVEVDLAAGTVAVLTTGAPDDALVAKTVDDAGYELTGRA